MRIYFCIIISILEIGLITASNQPPQANDIVILSNENHVILRRDSGNDIIFILEALHDHTDDLNGNWPNVDFTSIKVDVNRNRQIDDAVDVAYGVIGNTKDKLCTQYLRGPHFSSACGMFISDASLKVGFRSTPMGPISHPVWEYKIPKKELLTSGEIADITFEFYSPDYGFTKYPRSQQVNPSSFAHPEVDFSVTLSIDLAAPRIIILDPKVTRGITVSRKEGTIRIKGKAVDQSGIHEVLINGIEANIDQNGEFWADVKLAAGNNGVQIKATDAANNSTVESFTINREADAASLPASGMNNFNLSIGTYYALIIAEQDYQDPGINSLDNPIQDAARVKEVLTRFYTFEERNIIFLKNPNRATIITKFDELILKLSHDDSLLVFYAGHGYWDENLRQGFWIPSNARRENRSEWLPNSTVRDYIGGIKARHILLISDACFSGSIFKTRDAFGAAPVPVQELYKFPSRKALTSGAMKAVPDKSVFVEYLIKRLTENHEPYISSEELFASMRKAVINNSPNNQIPQYGEIRESGDEGGDFIFIRR